MRVRTRIAMSCGVFPSRTPTARGADGSEVHENIMSNRRSTKEIPSWLLPAAIAVGIVLLAFIGWRVYTAPSVNAGPPMEVKPGQFDIRSGKASFGQSSRHRDAAGH